MAENLGMDIHVTAKGARQVAVDLDAVTRAAERAEQAAAKNTKGWQKQAEEFHKNEEATKKYREEQEKLREEAEKMRESLGDLLDQINPMDKKLREIDRLEQELRKSYKLGIIETDKYAESLKKLNADRDAATGGNKSYADSIKEIAGALGLAAVAAKGFNLIQDVTQTAARYEQLGVLMNTLGATAGYSAIELERVEKSLVDMGISMTQARDVVQSMISSNMELAQSTELARLAQDAATIGGISSSDALQRLIQGIQTANVQVLRNIGIVVNFEQAYSSLADTLGKSTSALTEGEKQQARVNAVLAEAPALAGAYENSMETASKKAGSMERHILNLKTAMGEVFQPVYAASIDAQSAAIESASKNAKALSLALAGVVAGVTVLTAGIATATVGVTAFNAALNLIRGHPVVLALSVMASLATAGYLAWSDSARGANEYKGSLDILDGTLEEVSESLRKLNSLQQQSLQLKLADKILEESAKLKKATEEMQEMLKFDVAFESRSGDFDLASQLADLTDLFSKGEVSADEFTAALTRAAESGGISQESIGTYIEYGVKIFEAKTETEKLTQQQALLQQAMAETDFSARQTADGVATLDQAMADALKAGESYAKSLSERALVAGLSTETAMLKARESAGLLKFATDEAREAALKDAKAIDDANEARKNATKAASAYSSALKAEEQAYKDLIKTAMPYEAAVAQLATHTATLDKALAKGKITNEQYNATIKSLTDSYNKAVIATVPHLSAIDAEVKTTESAVRSMKQRIDTFGMTATAVARAALAETNARIGTLEVIKATQAATGASAKYIEQIDLEIDALKRLQIQQEHLVGVSAINDQNEARLRAANELAAETKRTHDEIEKSLTDALLRGFESGEGFGKNFINTLKNMFATLVLRPIIQPIASSAAGAVTGALGLGVSGGVKGSLGVGQNISSLYSAATGGITKTLAGGIGKLGETFGSSALQSFASGMSGAAMSGALASAAGSTVAASGLAGVGGSLTIGSGAAASLGTSAATGGALGGMSGAGAALGAAMPWIAGAAALYGIASSFMNKGETRTGGGFVYNPATGETNYAGGPSGGSGGADAAVSGLFKSASDTITGVLEAAGASARLQYFHGAFESSEKGRGGTFSGGELTLSDGTSLGFGGSKKGHGFGGTSGTPEEMLGNLQNEVFFSTLEAWQAASGEFPSVVRDMLGELDVRALTAEQAQDAVQGISEFTFSIRGLIDALDVLPIKNLSGLSFDAAASLAEMSGGIDNLMSSIGGYYEYFYTESERNAFATRNMADQLRSVGVAIPRTRDEFRSLAESLDLGTEAGQRMYSTMLNVVDAANDFYSAFESAAQAISGTIGNLYERITLDVLGTDEKRYQYYSDQFESLSKQLAISEDASEIQRLIESMTNIAGSAYGLLDKDAIQGGKGQQYLDMLDDMQALADQRLENAREKALQEQNEQNNQIVASLVHSLNEAGANLSQSAAQVGSAVSSINSRVDGMSDTVGVLSRALMSMRGSEINQ